MKIIRSIRAFKKRIAAIKQRGLSIGFVPTMGALHKGHLSLMRRARRETDIVVVSIFVNPIQFGPQEDFKQYPRPFRHDITLAQSVNADLVFCPATRAIYPPGFQTIINQSHLPAKLCGRSRPAHFQGVMTVVAKLFNLVQPDTAYFGQKDYQQALIIKQMVRELNMNLRIKTLPTVREEDGLAMSSRNAYLKPEERQYAPCLYRALSRGKTLIKRGEKSAKKIISTMRRIIQNAPNTRIDYIALVDPETLTDIKRLGQQKVLIALAVHVGTTRLIDNMLVMPK